MSQNIQGYTECSEVSVIAYSRELVSLGIKFVRVYLRNQSSYTENSSCILYITIRTLTW